MNWTQIADILVDSDIANGCGGKDGVNFDKLLDNFRASINCDPVKFDKWRYELRYYGCIPHDLDYFLGGNWITRWIADMKLISFIYRQSHWVDLGKRIGGCLLIYIGLRKY